MLLCSIGASAQDVIVKKDRSTILCRVVEINQTEVIYKRWSDLQGANYVMNLSDVLAINYENGEKKTMDGQTGNTPSTTTSPFLQNNNRQQTVSDDALLKMVKTPEGQLKKAKKIKIAGLVTGSALATAGLITLIKGKFDWYDEKDHAWESSEGMMIVGAVIFISGATVTSSCLIKAHNIKKKSQYSVQNLPLYQHDFTLKNGTSLSAGVDMLKDHTRRNATLGIGLSYNF